ncbi:MAG: precorrin-6y C5,15-methyltransferase (decarboxylating) subunit CbiE [Devosia sp.]
MSVWLDIIGMSEMGIEALPPALRQRVTSAGIVLGPERLVRGLRNGVVWKPTLEAMLEQVKHYRDTATVILATGDPMWFGIGATLSQHLDISEYRVHPGASAFQLAALKMGWPLQNAVTISIHGRPPELLHPLILPGNRILALTTDATTAPHVARMLEARGYSQSRLTVLENLGATTEKVSMAPAAGFALSIGDFYVLAIDCVADAGAALLPPVPGLPDDIFATDGQLTKREVRATSLAKLAPYPGALLWDVGAGCGSIAVEWMRAARDAKAIAFEREGERLQMIAVNADKLGVPGIRMINGDAPGNFAGLPIPDALFLGGSVADEALFEACWIALRAGGRLVANAVTIEGEQALFARQARLGGELARIEVSVIDSVGTQRVMRPRMAVLQWGVLKPDSPA